MVPCRTGARVLRTPGSEGKLQMTAAPAQNAGRTLRRVTELMLCTGCGSRGAGPLWR